MELRRLAIALVLLLWWGARALAADPPDVPPADPPDVPPLFQLEASITSTVCRALGPFFETRQDDAGGDLLAVRPLFSTYAEPVRNRFSFDLLYPLFSYRRNGTDGMAQVFPLIARWQDDDVYDAKSPWQFYLLPIFWIGHSRSDDPYLALFPLGGVIRDFWTYNKAAFVLFPVYLYTVRMENVVSHHVLFPIFTKTDGPGLTKRRVFPLLGYNRQEGRWVNYFCLWPLFNWGFSLDPQVEGSAFAVFPLFGRMHYRCLDGSKWVSHTQLLWPLFKILNASYGWEYHLPWPFVILSEGMDGPGSFQTYLWPIWGHQAKGQTAGKERETSSFWFWPLYLQYHRPTLDGYRDSRYVAIFFLQAVDRSDKGEAIEQFYRLYPLLTLTLRQDGQVHFRLLDVWPQRHAEAFERNLQPFFTLYEYRADAERYRHEVLWGAWQFQRQRGGYVERHNVFPLFNYKRSADGTEKRLDLLTGLIGRAWRDNGSAQYRFLWFIRINTKGETDD